MKNLYSTILALTVVIAAGLLLSNTHKSDTLPPIDYNLYKGERTANRLLGEIDLALDANKEWKEGNFYVVFSECNKQQKIDLEYCDDCPLQKMIRASNRFLVLDKSTKLPVIFEGDKIHSNFAKVSSTPRTEPIVYSMDGVIVDEIRRGIEDYKALVPRLKLEDTDFYISYNECSEQRIAIVGYCKGCAFKDLIAATNSFFQVTDDLRLPIIFESDRQHSNFFASPDGIRIFITVEGYMVVTDKENNIVSKGFTQY